MRLLSTQDFTFHEFHEDAVPEYAILSHTWDGNEVTMQDMLQSNARTILMSSNPPSKHWKKIKDACLNAHKKGYSYIWIDTCCIDKANSAELQEAINSMFRWYRNSSLCLALLSDVDKSDFQLDQALRSHATRFCRWFTRGWALQELLAPDHLVFFDVNWKEMGSRSEWASDISKATGIHAKFLLGLEPDHCKTWDLEAVLRDTSVATKMSWAAGRQTTRIEDQAYCLLGLFGIHMPMLYGEGRKAFARLQQEIMKSTDDCTLLAWGYNEPLLGAPVSEIPFFCHCCRCHEHHQDKNRTSSVPTRPTFLQYPHLPICAYADVTTGPQGGVLVEGKLHRYLSGHNAGGRPRPLFATSPQDFRLAGGLESCSIPGHKRPAFSTSQRGLEISLPIVKDELYQYIVYGLLACGPKVKTEESYLIAIPLIHASLIDAASAGHDDEYVQSPFCLPCKVPVSFSAEAERMSICIRNEDRYRRLWDSVGYSMHPLIFDFGHPLAAKKEGSTLRLELMYPPQPLVSMYFTLLRDSCPYNATSCSAFSMWPRGAGLGKPDWESYHITGPLRRHRVPSGLDHPWDKFQKFNVLFDSNTTFVAAVLNFDPYFLNCKGLNQTRILLVVSKDGCRVKELGPDEVVTLPTLMTIATKPELVGPKLEPKRGESKDHEGWKEERTIYEMPNGIELCIRVWG